jgi:hypothetical protein
MFDLVGLGVRAARSGIHNGLSRGLKHLGFRTLYMMKASNGECLV